ncbi:translation initiation factor 2 [Pseudoflavonifractor phocaeensis]|uniref:translation initiation factor 2 n=1 Tax=Pseudoflavonifractor phocaeensis TaxID=1870988 RepID=UPI0025A3188D|nr:translation initiation factor 2 [Pseudoflavonifractor phocaeensis]MDM8238603.1 translation initiation factor 2 [Pseudoflavonifractor phocaeensis]
MEMVKGITRQVILVKSPDPKLFEEAIFIVKEEALAREGVSADQVIRQARQAADGYLKSGRAWNQKLERLDRFRGPIWGAAGAAAASLAWYAAMFLL